jgi:signal transduction histidine kinase
MEQRHAPGTVRCGGGGDHVNRRPDGRIFNVRKFNLDDGTKVIFHFDITEAAEREAAIENALQLAETANSAKSQFLASVSHELRTPLNAIIGFNELQAQIPDDPLSATQSEYGGYVSESAGHLLSLVENLLDYANIEAGDFALNSGLVDPSAIIAQSIRMTEGLARAHNISVDTEFAEPVLPTVTADASHLLQVLINVLSNAIIYNRDGGRVIISANAPADGMLRIDVFNTGDGLSQEQQAQLFEPFKRLGREAGEIEGTGIGLTICHELMRQMSGEIGVTSELGAGTTIWISLPLAPEQ